MEHPGPTQNETFVQRMRRLFHPGPLDWILGLTPRKERFRAGERLHGLDSEDGRLSASRGRR